MLTSLCLFAVCTVVYAQSNSKKDKPPESGKAAPEHSNPNVDLARVHLQLKKKLELTDNQIQKLKKILQGPDSKTKQSSSREPQSRGMMAMCQEMTKKRHEMMKKQQQGKGCRPMMKKW